MLKSASQNFFRAYSSRIGRYAATASGKLAQSRLSNIPTPKALKKFLDEYIVGQEIGKKVLSVAVYNHYLRINDKQKKGELQRQRELMEREKIADDKDEPIFSGNSESKAGWRNLQRQFNLAGREVDEDLELSKSNVLVVGPSGSGKTLLATTLAKILNVPIAITDCTQLTQAGYIGEDVEVCIERLLVNAEFDVARAEKGIIVLDEIDKLAKPAASIGTKDVSGEGVQQSLLKIIEGHKVEITVKRPVKHDIDGQKNQTTTKKDEVFVVDTSNILFMIMGAFVGLDKHIVKRIEDMKKIQKAGESVESSNSKEVEKERAKKFRFSNTLEQVDLDNGKKVCALDLTTPTDLVSFGLIPELIGRVPIITALQPLQRDDLFHILKEPKNALLDQYEYIFKQFGVRLCVTQKALKKVAQFALKEGTGARGLRGIMERLLLNVNYDCPGSNIAYVLIDEATVDSLQETEHSLASQVDVKYYSGDEKDSLIRDVSEEDKKLGAMLEKELGHSANIHTPTIPKRSLT
ncbi:BGN_3a_G0004010.mRNA.1.CDS.1 [Saccharomyces cerevisiae]|nr:BGN_3a_G0004010.mRNA.1.CDS.1 [Saccharomyces cerevisiae]CAI7048612.1 BGN_3a_G0004010.mRNA.1.CDS.1 [Saccharomyces cerevisiae]